MPRGGNPVSILIDETTTFIVQGITGREAVNLTRECLEYGRGARIVGGVTPGRRGRDIHGVPVFDTVEQAVAHHEAPIDGAVVTVPPAFCRDAVFEAIECGIQLVVIVTERIPRRDVAQMVELAALRGARIIGPNCAELMPLFEADEQTEGIVIYTEPGGRMEAELARWVAENESRLPIAAFMAGRFMDAMPGMSFGHAGTIVEGKADTAAEKIQRLADAGITVAEEISEIPDLMREKLESRKAAV